MERRAALIFRGLSFYDARRWGWIYDIANGGGAYGQLLFNTDGTYDTNVTWTTISWTTGISRPMRHN